jgi:hypothetical protein
MRGFHERERASSSLVPAFEFCPKAAGWSSPPRFWTWKSFEVCVEMFRCDYPVVSSPSVNPLSFVYGQADYLDDSLGVLCRKIVGQTRRIGVRCLGGSGYQGV